MAKDNFVRRAANLARAHPISAALTTAAAGAVVFLFQEFILKEVLKAIHDLVGQAIGDGALQWFLGGGLWLTLLFALILLAISAFRLGERFGSKGYGLRYNLNSLDDLFEEGVATRNTLIQPMPEFDEAAGHKALEDWA